MDEPLNESNLETVDAMPTTSTPAATLSDATIKASDLSARGLTHYTTPKPADDIPEPPAPKEPAQTPVQAVSAQPNLVEGLPPQPEQAQPPAPNLSIPGLDPDPVEAAQAKYEAARQAAGQSMLATKQKLSELGFPPVNDDALADPAALHTHTQASINRALADPSANKQSAFGPNRLSPEADQLQQNLRGLGDSAASAISDHAAALDNLRTSYAALQAAKQPVVPQIPGLDPSSVSANAAQGEPASGHVLPHETKADGTSQPFAPTETPFRAAPDGSVQFDPSRLTQGLTAAHASGAIDDAKYQELLPKAAAAEHALAEQQKMLANDSIASKLKALGVGAGKGAAFLAGSVPGMEGGAALGALTGPAAPVAVPLFGAIGGAITGGIASWGADKILHRLSEQNDTIKSFTDAAEAHPYYDAAGNLISFGAGIPKAITGAAAKGLSTLAGTGEGLAAKGLRATAEGFERGVPGVVGSAKNLAQDWQTRVAGAASPLQASTATAARLGGYAAANTAIDTIIKEGSKALGLSDEGQTLPGAAQAALIGAFMSGHGLEVNGVKPEAVANAVVKQRMGVPLSPLESEIATAFQGELTKAVNEGRIPKNPSVDDLEGAIRRTAGQQMTQGGQPYGVTALKIGEPGAPSEHSQQPSPDSGPSQTPNTPAPSSGAPSQPETSSQNAPAEAGGSPQRYSQGSPYVPTPTPAAPAGQVQPNTQQQPASPDVAGVPAIQRAVMSGVMTHGEASARLQKLGLNGDDITRAIGPQPAESASNPAAPAPADELAKLRTQVADSTALQEQAKREGNAMAVAIHGKEIADAKNRIAVLESHEQEPQTPQEQAPSERAPQIETQPPVPASQEPDTAAGRVPSIPGLEEPNQVATAPQEGHRNVSSPESQDYIKNGGWKLHLTVPPENYAAVDEWLKENHPGQYKLLAGGDAGEKDFTVYVGDKSKAAALSKRIESEIGDKLSGNNTGSEDTKFTDKVAGRFDTNKKHGMSYYGREGLPYDAEAKQAEYQIKQATDPAQKAQWQKILANHEARIQKLLTEQYGERFTGNEPLSNAETQQEPVTNTEPTSPAREPAAGTISQSGDTAASSAPSSKIPGLPEKPLTAEQAKRVRALKLVATKRELKPAEQKELDALEPKEAPVALPQPGTDEYRALPAHARFALVEHGVNQRIIDSGKHPNGTAAKPAEIAALKERQKQVLENYQSALSNTAEQAQSTPSHEQPTAETQKEVTRSDEGSGSRPAKDESPAVGTYQEPAAGASDGGAASPTVRPLKPLHPTHVRNKVEKWARENAASLDRVGAKFEAGSVPGSGIASSSNGSVINYDPDKLSEISEKLAAHGDDPNAWLERALAEEEIHTRQLTLDRGNFTKVNTRLWGTLPQPVRQAWAAVYDGARNSAGKILPAHAYAEYERMLIQLRETGTFTEDGIHDRDESVYANLRKYLELPQNPEIEQHLANVESLTAVPEIPGLESPVAAKESLTEPEPISKRTFKVRTAQDEHFAAHPVAQAIANHGGLLSKSGAKAKWSSEKWEANKGEWDDVPHLSSPTHNQIYKPNGLQPDEMARALSDEGLLPEGAAPPELWKAIGQASESSARIRKQASAERRNQSEVMKQGKAFDKDAGNPKSGEPITADSLNVGDSVNVNGEHLRVTAVDPDTFAVTLEDHSKYGIQHVEEGQIIYGEVEKGEQSDAFSLEKPESVDEQRARMEAAQKKRDEEKAKAEMLDKAKAPLTGSAGDLSADMFGGGDTPLFNENRSRPRDLLANEPHAPTPKETNRLRQLNLIETKRPLRAEEEQERSALMANGPHAEKTEPFYSQLTRTIESFPQETMTVSQARAAIQKGAKPDEIKQQGILDDPLSPLVGKQPNDKVSKSDLLGYSLERQAKVQDVVLGAKKGYAIVWDAVPAGTDQRAYHNALDTGRKFPTKEEAQKQADAVASDPDNEGATPRVVPVAELEDEGVSHPLTVHEEDAAHFSQYQLPGADAGSYREMFVTWPENARGPVPNKAELDRLNQQLNEAQDELRRAEREAIENPGDVYLDQSLESLSRSVDGAHEAIRDYQARLIDGWQDGHSQYKDIANPIVRIRQNIRTDADGKRTYFLEEMQGPNSSEQQKMPPELRKRIYEIGMKRAIRDAIDEGADAIGWTTGEQQAERYDLTKQVDAVTVDRSRTGGFNVNMKPKGGTEFQRVGELGMSEGELESAIGKELARKAIAETSDANSRATFTGDGLKIGGEGLKNLYDTMLPRIASKLAEKVGGKVGVSELEESEDGHYLLEHPDYMTRREHGRQKASTAMAKLGDGWAMRPDPEHRKVTPASTIHSMPIPEAWKEQAPSFALYANEPHLTNEDASRKLAHDPITGAPSRIRGKTVSADDAGAISAINRERMERAGRTYEGLRTGDPDSHALWSDSFASPRTVKAYQYHGFEHEHEAREFAAVDPKNRVVHDPTGDVTWGSLGKMWNVAETHRVPVPGDIEFSARVLGIPVLSVEKMHKIQALPKLGSGAEGMAYRDDANGVVYKVYIPRAGNAIGLRNMLIVNGPAHNQSVESRRMNGRAQDVAQKAAVLSAIGMPTEIVGIDTIGSIITKQPMADESKVSRPSMLLPAELQKIGAVPVPWDGDFDPAGEQAYVVNIGGQHYIFNDASADRNARPNSVGDTRAIDVVSGNITDEALSASKTLREAADKAKPLDGAMLFANEPHGEPPKGSVRDKIERARQKLQEAVNKPVEPADTWSKVHETMTTLRDQSGWASLVDDIQKFISPDSRLTPAERERFIKNGDPNAIGDARKTGIFMDGITAAMDRRKKQWEAALWGAKKLVDSLPKEQQRELMMRVDEGRELKPGPYKDAVDQLAELDRQKVDEMKAWFDAHGQSDWGNYQNYLKNIVPVQFKDEQAAGKVLDGFIRQRKMQGGTGWLKHRADISMREMIDYAKEQGVTLEPKHDNIMDAVMDRWTQQERYKGAHDLIDRMEKMGTGHWEPTDYEGKPGEKQVNNIIGQRVAQVPIDRESPGRKLVPITDKDGEEIEGTNMRRQKQYFWAQEPAANIINNYLSRGLRAGHKWIENYFIAANALNSAQLGLSFFHGGFVTMEGMVSSFALGLQKALSGNMSGLKDIATAPFSTWHDWKLGGKVRDEMLNPGKYGEQMQSVVNSMVDGGFRDGLDSFYKDWHIQKFMAALRDKKIIPAILRAPFALIEAAAKPIMEHYVPRMKAAAVYKLAEMHLAQDPNITPMEMRRRLQEDVRSGNNRFGQMSYDNLHLHKTVKDLLMGATRSLGWNWGTASELGGGVADWVRFAKQAAGAAAGKGAMPRVTNKMAYTLALPILVGLMGAALSAMFGQKPKELKDYYYVNTGELDERGNPVRVSLPSYMKDIAHVIKDPVSTVTNKLHPLLSMIGDMLRNKDFYGVEIRHAGDPVMKQILQELSHVGKQFVPFTGRNAQKLHDAKASPLLQVGGFIGITQAPASVNKTAAQTLADKIANDSRPNKARTSEDAEHSQLRSRIIGMLRAGNAGGKAELSAALQSGKLQPKDVQYIQRMARMTPLQASVSHLSPGEAERVFEKATPEERRQLEAIMQRKQATQIASQRKLFVPTAMVR